MHPTVAFEAEWIESQRQEHETEKLWRVRQAFFQSYSEDYPRERLVVLSMCLVNVLFLGNEYHPSLMKLVDEFRAKLKLDVVPVHVQKVQEKVVRSPRGPRADEIPIPVPSPSSIALNSLTAKRLTHSKTLPPQPARRTQVRDMFQRTQLETARGQHQQESKPQERPRARIVPSQQSPRGQHGHGQDRSGSPAKGGRGGFSPSAGRPPVVMRRAVTISPAPGVVREERIRLDVAAFTKRTQQRENSNEQRSNRPVSIVSQRPHVSSSRPVATQGRRFVTAPTASSTVPVARAPPVLKDDSPTRKDLPPLIPIKPDFSQLPPIVPVGGSLFHRLEHFPAMVRPVGATTVQKRADDSKRAEVTAKLRNGILEKLKTDEAKTQDKPDEAKTQDKPDEAKTQDEPDEAKTQDEPDSGVADTD